jgi:FAD/FMN-containing dehydrogenase
VGIESPYRALELLRHLKQAAGDALTTFELMPRFAVALTVGHIPGVANPLDQGASWYVLAELTSPNPRQRLGESLGDALQEAAAGGVVVDASIATSIAQSQAMWKLRESVPEAQRRHGASLKHDISVPVSRIPELIERGAELVRRLAPEGDVVSYGHVGDGNLHFNVSLRPDAPEAAFLSRAKPLESAMFDLVESLGGSISAEHGIGRLKAPELQARAVRRSCRSCAP